MLLTVLALIVPSATSQDNTKSDDTAGQSDRSDDQQNDQITLGDFIFEHYSSIFHGQLLQDIGLEIISTAPGEPVFGSNFLRAFFSSTHLHFRGRLDADGSLDSSFNAANSAFNIAQNVVSIAVGESNKIYIAGNGQLTIYRGSQRREISSAQC